MVGSRPEAGRGHIVVVRGVELRPTAGGKTEPNPYVWDGNLHGAFKDLEAGKPIHNHEVLRRVHGYLVNNHPQYVKDVTLPSSEKANDKDYQNVADHLNKMPEADKKTLLQEGNKTGTSWRESWSPTARDGVRWYKITYDQDVNVAQSVSKKG